MALFRKYNETITMDFLLPKCSDNVIKILQKDTNSKIKDSKKKS